MVQRHKEKDHRVTKSGIQLLATQKPIRSQAGEKKGCFTSEAGNEGWVGRRLDACPKADSPTDNQWAKAFIDKGRGLRLETASQL